MLVVGLTGGTASGKTEVAKVLRKRGAIVVSGDQIGKEVVEKNPQVLKKLVKAFGKEILQSNRKLNRKKLGRIAFASEKNQKRLNLIVHPYLLKELRSRIVEAKKIETDKKFLVVDAALITEWRLEKELDVTVLVASPAKVRLKRLLQQGLSKKEAQNRIARQLSDRERRKSCDFVIENDSSLKKLTRKAFNLYHILMVLTILEELENMVRRFDKARFPAYIFS